MSRNSDALIHNGDSTHHHDQAIYPKSLRVINTMVSNPENPIPLDELDDCDIIIHLLSLQQVSL